MTALTRRTALIRVDNPGEAQKVMVKLGERGIGSSSATASRNEQIANESNESYLSNERDAKILTSPSGQKKLARALFEGIKAYEKVYSASLR